MEFNTKEVEFNTKKWNSIGKSGIQYKKVDSIFSIQNIAMSS